MRSITAEEAKRWMQLAEEQGHVRDGHFELGRFRTEFDREHDPPLIHLRIVTPIVAPERDEELQPKTPPIMFDRTEDGRLIIPGRWIANVFEGAAMMPETSAAERAVGLQFARAMIPDMYMPADFDTIEVEAPNEEGEFVVFEALPPGGTITIRLSKPKRP
jgi:hypothetical protein